MKWTENYFKTLFVLLSLKTLYLLVTEYCNWTFMGIMNNYLYRKLGIRGNIWIYLWQLKHYEQRTQFLWTLHIVHYHYVITVLQTIKIIKIWIISLYCTQYGHRRDITYTLYIFGDWEQQRRSPAAHPCSLISVFVIHALESIMYILATSKIQISS